MGDLTFNDGKPLGFQDIVSKTVGTDKKKYKPLLNKRILVISAPPQKINFNLQVAKDHPTPAVFGKNGTSKIRVQLDKDAY